MRAIKLLVLSITIFTNTALAQENIENDTSKLSPYAIAYGSNGTITVGQGV